MFWCNSCMVFIFLAFIQLFVWSKGFTYFISCSIRFDSLQRVGMSLFKLCILFLLPSLALNCLQAIALPSLQSIHSFSSMASFIVILMLAKRLVELFWGVLGFILLEYMLKMCFCSALCFDLLTRCDNRVAIDCISIVLHGPQVAPRVPYYA